jgi:hypothetical protein
MFERQYLTDGGELGSLKASAFACSLSHLFFFEQSCLVQLQRRFARPFTVGEVVPKEDERFARHFWALQLLVLTF